MISNLTQITNNSIKWNNEKLKLTGCDNSIEFTYFKLLLYDEVKKHFLFWLSKDGHDKGKSMIEFDFGYWNHKFANK